MTTPAAQNQPRSLNYDPSFDTHLVEGAIVGFNPISQLYYVEIQRTDLKTMLAPDGTSQTAASMVIQSRLLVPPNVMAQMHQAIGQQLAQAAAQPQQQVGRGETRNARES